MSVPTRTSNAEDSEFRQVRDDARRFEPRSSETTVIINERDRAGPTHGSGKRFPLEESRGGRVLDRVIHPKLPTEAHHPESEAGTLQRKLTHAGIRLSGGSDREAGADSARVNEPDPTSTNPLKNHRLHTFISQVKLGPILDFKRNRDSKAERGASTSEAPTAREKLENSSPLPPAAVLSGSNERVGRPTRDRTRRARVRSSGARRGGATRGGITLRGVTRPISAKTKFVT